MGGRIIYIFGHLNPDTDSICSAIAYGDLKRNMGEDNIQVCRLGNLSKETKFALNYFGVEEPELLKDVKPQLSDLNYYEPSKFMEDATVKNVWDFLKKREGRRMSVVTDQQGKLVGVVSLGDILRLLMEETDSRLSYKNILFANLVKTLDGKLTGNYPHDKMQGRFLTDGQVLSGDVDITKDDIIITPHLNNLETIKQCGCIILTDGKEAPQETAACILQTPYSFIEAVNLLSLSISVSEIMRKSGIECFVEDNYIEDVIELTKSSTHRNFPILSKNGEIKGIFSRRHLIDYERKKVILVDHNEQSQSVEGIEQADIIEIIDHHRVANVSTMEPLFIRSEPVGATSTIIFKMYMENFLKPSREIAGIMLSAILSDTLMFNSPTCTKEDREAAYKLAKLSGVDIDDYGEEMFKASASLEGYSNEDILGLDCKEFSFGKYRVLISQINTLDFRGITEREEGLVQAMETMSEKMQLDLVILMITDVVNNGSEMLAVGKAKDLLTEAFGIPKEQRSYYLQNIVSRKKQVVPKLAAVTQII